MSFIPLLALLVLSFSAHAERLPRPDHVVVVIEENRGYKQIMNQSKRDSYIHALAKRGMLFTRSYGVTHPSQPNYLALFSGSTQGVISNSCPHTFDSDNLATALLDKGLSFVSYSESLPVAGDTRCTSGAYQRKHNPLVNWQGTRLPASLNMGFDAADAWLRTHINPYVEWAFKHNSLLILTWDEDNYREDNHIVTLLLGPMVKTGISDQPINHYNLLRTLLDFYDLPALGASSDAETIMGIWK